MGMAADAKRDPVVRQRSLLVVDDDEAFRTASTAVLRGAGYAVSVAPDHRLALQMLEGDNPVDLLLVDIVMPDRVNGFALARMARLRRPGLKVIYMSGYDLPNLNAEALGPVIRKPIDSDALLAQVRLSLSD